MEEISELATDKIPTRNPDSISSSCSGLSGSRSLDNPRFCPSSFGYNARVAATFGICGALLLCPAGSPVVATFTFGLIIAGFFELFDRTGAFFKVWGPLIATQIALVFRSWLYPSFNSLAIAAFCTQINFLIGVWASRTQIKNVLIVQRLLYALVPFTASSIFNWATISADYGMFNVSYYIMGFNCVFYWLFAIPRASSFKSKQEGKNHGGEVPDENLILNPLESCFLTLNLLFFPVLFHIASHYPVLLLYLPAMTDVLLLPLIPLVFLLYASLRGALWWVSKIFVQLSCFDDKFVHFSNFHFLNGVMAMLVIHHSLDTRGAYSLLPLLPLNYALMITITLGGAMGAASLDMVSRSFCFKAITALAAVACAVGHPVLLILLPSVACLSSALFSTKKSVPSYFAFVVLGCLMVMWFVMQNYWDLYVWLAGMSIKAIIILISAVPASTIMPGKLHLLAEVGLVIHALLLCDIENQYFSYLGVYFYGRDDDTRYPSFMVIVTTTLLGLVLVRRLFVDQRVRPEISWFLICLYSSKLIVLFVTSKSVVWASVVLLLAISAPFFLYRGRSRGASQMKSAGGSSGDIRGDGELDDLREPSKPVSKRKLKNELKRLQWSAMN